MTVDSIDLIIGMEFVPIQRAGDRANTALVVALSRAGALPVLQVGVDDLTDQIAVVTARSDKTLALQPTLALALSGPPTDVSLSSVVTTVLFDALTAERLARAAKLQSSVELWGRYRVIVEITSLQTARMAVAAGADGLIAKGCESGGRVGSTETFVLLQQTVDLGVPVWARGGIGLHTAAGAIAVGARGVVLDSQLALVRESRLPADVRSAIAAMDGSETRVVGGHRVYTRPDLETMAAATAASAATTSDEVALELGTRLGQQLLPVGQDGAFAGELERRFKTAGGVVAAVRSAIQSHIEAAAEHSPLRPQAGVASTHHTRYPIAQGPMTRVSDQAAFAAAVAEGGGLPFLALALLPGREVEPLLAETAALLQGRPWGVGILGFVPAELREEQLAVVRAACPPVALIAGGRPSQATSLEEAGIATYLHVPSPGLLDRFVRDGARRFVFEGRECGGHVGPRASFPLWESQVEALCSVPDAENLHVLFAGGIHDARSAAAVAAIGAPLAARGAHLGVLMGTAYLFTKEAVATGAITKSFQEAAVSCEETALLETSPGHATRCAHTTYVTTFEAARAKLEADQVSTKQMWAELEMLNLGRLRVASKGLTHGPEGLEPVDDATQKSEGMFMLGQVATLRSEVTTIAALHEGVSAGGTDHVLRLAHDLHRPAESQDPKPLDIAIVGMASMFPGSTTAEEFWTTIVNGLNSVTEVPKSRWDADIYYDPESTTTGAGKKTPSKWGGFLSEVGFDPLAYGIPPASLAAIEPVQLLSLEVATKALADAGYADREFDRSRVSVIFGAENGNDLSGAYGMRAMIPQVLGEMPAELDEFLPALTEDSFPGVLTNVIAGRIANRLDLGGLNFTVDAACAASLAAIDAACKELMTGNSDVVLCGAADVHNGINDFLLFSSVHALSPTGQCKTFDSKADGIALGEGVACVVLKRRLDAERDGDRIYAVIEAVAGSSDGRHLGLTAPRKEGQQLALERAYAQAGLSPSQLGLVEAHGTGTVVGDKTELVALSELWSENQALVGECVLGSVKSQIGHTKCAAGLAGLIKTANALYRGVLPPTGNLSSPNAAYDATTSPFRFLEAAQPWLGDDRHAGVSAFGFGGANFHAVLSSYDGDDGPAFGVDTWPAELFVFRADQLDDVLPRLESVEQLAESIAKADPRCLRHRLRDLAHDVARTGSGPVQVAVVATSFEDLAAKLASAQGRGAKGNAVFVAGAEVIPEGRSTPMTAFLYPGQGSQRPGMFADLFVTFPRLREFLLAGQPWVSSLFPPAGFGAEAKSRQLAAITDTRVAQPVLGICGLAMTSLLESVGVTPDVTAGHSYGELVALAAAGAFEVESFLKLSEARGYAIVNAAAALGDDPGTMAAVNASPETVTTVLAGRPDVVIANHNSPSQVVISGATSGVAEVIEQLQSAGIAAKALKVACAFHSPLVASASADFALELASITVETPQVPVFTNMTATCYPAAPDEIRAMLADHVAESVHFVDEIEAMYAAGVTVFVEAGPGRVLTQLVNKILGDRPHTAIATDVSGEHGVHRYLLALGELAVSGFDIDTEALFVGRTAAIDSKRLPMKSPGWTIDGHLVRQASGKVVEGSLRPANECPTVAVGVAKAPVREATVLEYLHNLREVVAAERDVMLAFLGAPVESVSVAGMAPAESLNSAVQSPAEQWPEQLAVASELEPVRGEALVAVVLSVVAERTGYPTDMLELDLDLEADLSIDSIKRIEIIGELAERIGLDATGEGLDDSVVEQLAQLKSLREIVAWIDNLGDQPGPGATAPELLSPELLPAGLLPAGASKAADRLATPGATATMEVPATALRFAVRTIAIDPPSLERRRLDSLRVVIADDSRGVSDAVAANLAQWGAEVHVVNAGSEPTEAELEMLEAAHALVWLRALHPETVARPGAFDARTAFAWWRPALTSHLKRLVVATAGAGSFVTDPTVSAPGLGLAGMAKTLGRELNMSLPRIVDLDPKGDPDFLGACVVDEFFDTDESLLEVGYDGLQRVTRVVIPAAVLPAADVDEWTPESVALVTGGARGITAHAAFALVTAGIRKIELVGRSPLPKPQEDPIFTGSPDALAIRRVLIDCGQFDGPAAIEAECSRVLAAREIRATMARLDAAGCAVVYHQADVRDADALSHVVKDIQDRRGRLDVVLHGAGVLDDRLIKDKRAEGFGRVFATKVDAARTLLETTDEGTTLVFFGSVSGVFGNRGQVDYAAANDALDEMAEAARRVRSGRVVALDWGPWAGTGMVSAELEREYARRGVGLIAPEEGTRALLDELMDPSAQDGHVVVMRARPEVLAPEMARWLPAEETAAQ